MTLDTATIEARHAAAGAAWNAATTEQTWTSLYLLATAIREQDPDAVSMTLEWSDQGDWLSPFAEVKLRDGAETEYDDEDGYAYALDESTRATWQPFTQRGEDRRSVRETFVLDDILTVATAALSGFDVTGVDLDAIRAHVEHNEHVADSLDQDDDPAGDYQRMEYESFLRDQDDRPRNAPTGRVYTDADLATIHQAHTEALLAEYAEWREQRAEYSANDGTADGPDSDDWHASDDDGCDLARRLASHLAALTGNPDPDADTDHNDDKE